MARQGSIAALALGAALLLALASGGCGPMAATSLAEQGLREARAGNYDKALATCDEALQLNPRDYQAYNSRGTAYHLRNGAGDFDRAIADFNAAVRLAPNNADAYYNRAIAYRDHGDQEKAEADEEKARDLDVELKETYAQLPKTAAPAGAAPTGETSLEGDARGNLPQSAREQADEFDEYVRLRDKFRPKSEQPTGLDPGLETPRGWTPSDTFGRPATGGGRAGLNSNSTDELSPSFGGPRPLGSLGSERAPAPLPGARAVEARDSSTKMTRRPVRSCRANWRRRRGPIGVPRPPRSACRSCPAASIPVIRMPPGVCGARFRRRSRRLNRGRRAFRAKSWRATTARRSPPRGTRPIHAYSRSEGRFTTTSAD